MAFEWLDNPDNDGQQAASISSVSFDPMRAAICRCQNRTNVVWISPLPSETATMSNRFQRISPFLWFNEEAEEAANYYVSLFENSRVLYITRYDGEAPRPLAGPRAPS